MKHVGTAGLTAWPVNVENENADITCIGFSELALPYIKDAVLRGTAVVVGDRPLRQNGLLAFLEFDWLGFRYEIVGTWNGSRITVESVEKIAKVDIADDSDLAAEEFLAEHNLVVEDYRAQRLLEQPSYGTW